MEFPDSTEKLTATLEWMVLNKVIKQPQFYQNTILFAHDKIEEFFLTEYIQFYYKEELLKGFSQISLYYLPSPIVQNCIYGLLEMVLRQNKDSFIKHAISVIVEKNQVLVMLTVRLLLENDTQLYKIIKEVEQFVCRRDLEDFIYTMLEYMEMKIDHYESFSLTAMQNIHHYIHSSVIGNSLRLLALNNYIYAKYIWAFPIETEEISYDTAIALCKKVSTFDKEMLPTKLLDKNNRLLAILLRNSGQLNEAAELMNCVYNSLYENAYFDDACQALLDLGAIYRELTWFDKALDIYKKYPIEFVTDLQLKNRLYMHMGIIYKNKAQNALFSQDKNYDTICQKYKKAKELFEQVYMYADEAHLIPLLLEILAELVETMVIGYHLNLATIADVAGYMEKMDTLLPKYPVPVRRIQNCRMWARVLTLRGQFVDAISKLKDGFQIAIHYNIPFRAADCCNQISGILCDNINSKFITRELLMEGIEACQYSINYYSQLKQSRHLYLSDTHKKLKKLNDALKEFG